MRLAAISAAALAPALLLAACGSGGGGGDAAVWVVDHEQSALRFTGDYAGKGFEGEFGEWNASIVFSPEDLENSFIQAEVQIASLESGDNSRDQAALGSQWLNAGEFPMAVYRAEEIEAVGAGYVAHGTLTIVGVTSPLDLHFTVTIDGDAAHAVATTSFDHHDVGVTGGYYDEETGDMFGVEAEIVATLGPAADADSMDEL